MKHRERPRIVTSALARFRRCAI